jgi:hypothetical protein
MDNSVDAALARLSAPHAGGAHSGGEIRVLLGVMSNPTGNRLRSQLREWNSGFTSFGKGVDVRFVFGSHFHGNASSGAGSSAAPDGVAAAARAEDERQHDLLYVDGRERLPHVGVVTEKSAAFWRGVGAALPGYDYYCKSDDVRRLVSLHRPPCSVSPCSLAASMPLANPHVHPSMHRDLLRRTRWCTWIGYTRPSRTWHV